MLKVNKGEKALTFLAFLESGARICEKCPYLWAPRSTGSFLFILTCQECREFVGLPGEWPEDARPSVRCPCKVLGPDEAVKRAWLRLEEMGALG